MFTLSISQPVGALDHRSFFRQLSGMCSNPTTPAAPLMHETVFQRLLLDVMTTERPVEFRRFRRLLYEAVVHFRTMKGGNLATGFSRLQQMRDQFVPLPSEVRRLGEAMLTPMMAYYYFRTGDYPTAGYYNQQAVAIASELQQTYPVLHLHQIQQQVNLSRIDLACHHYTDAFLILKELINYLVIGRLPQLTGRWTLKLRDGLDKELIANQLLDILNELVFTSLRLPELEAVVTHTVLEDLGQTMSRTEGGLSSPAAALLIWWQSACYAASDQYPLFLMTVNKLINDYPADYDQLKLLLLGRLHSVVTHSTGENVDQLRLIRRFVNTKLRLSPRLLQHIRNLRSQEKTA